MAGGRDRSPTDEHPAYVLLEARDVHALTDAVKSLSRVLVQRVEKMELEKLDLLKAISSNTTRAIVELAGLRAEMGVMTEQIGDLRTDVNQLLDALVRHGTNGDAGGVSPKEPR